jgi:vacuolar-type H+-ATPase subunit F/Vma7
MVITTPDLAPGFQLAGVETFAVDSIAEAEATLTQLLDNRHASLIIVRRALLQALPVRLQRRLEASTQPVVMAIAGRPTKIPDRAHRQHITELIRRTVGFHISFEGGKEQAGSKTNEPI